MYTTQPRTCKRIRYTLLYLLDTYVHINDYRTNTSRNNNSYYYTHMGRSQERGIAIGN